MTVHKLSLQGLAACLYRGLRRLAHGPGPAYLYKPILHLILPRVRAILHPILPRVTMLII